MPIPALSVIDQFSAAMSVSSLQNQVNASNIANRDSLGYQRLQLRFENALDRTGAVSVVPDRTHTTVSIEQDIVAMSSNAAHYGALARVLSHYFSLLATITRPGGH